VAIFVCPAVGTAAARNLGAIESVQGYSGYTVAGLKKLQASLLQVVFIHCALGRLAIAVFFLCCSEAGNTHLFVSCGVGKDAADVSSWVGF